MKNQFCFPLLLLSTLWLFFYACSNQPTKTETDENAMVSEEKTKSELSENGNMESPPPITLHSKEEIEALSNEKNKKDIALNSVEIIKDISEKKWDKIAKNKTLTSILKGLYGETFQDILDTKDPHVVLEELTTYSLRKVMLEKEMESINKKYKTHKGYPTLTKALAALKAYHFEEFHAVLSAFKNDPKKGITELPYVRAEEYSTRGKFLEASEQYNQAIAIDNRKKNLYLTKYSAALLSANRFDDVIALHRKELYAKKMANITVDNSEISDDLNNMGLGYYGLKKYKEAIAHFNQSLEFDKETYGEEHSSVANKYINLGLAYVKLGEHNTALEYYDKALHIEKKIYGEIHPNIAIIQYDKGVCYRTANKYDSAILCFEIALKVYSQFYGPEHLKVADVYKVIASTYQKAGKPDLAESYLEKGQAIDNKHFGQFRQYDAK